ncbi:glycosyltransferase, partial [Candidatus Micrarchaeota archaeon]|nr:glycosyltransferase [Candidatus Micrarchaeota archaeon]
MSSPLVSVVILNWNGRDYLESCIRSVLGQDYKWVEVVVVDNGSGDGSVELVKRLFLGKGFGKVKLVENGVNLGYCVGNNIGVRNSVGEFVVTLNPDVVLEKDFVSEALKPFK